jgi:hypothetical protein
LVPHFLWNIKFVCPLALSRGPNWEMKFERLPLLVQSRAGELKLAAPAGYNAGIHFSKAKSASGYRP